MQPSSNVSEHLLSSKKHFKLLDSYKKCNPQRLTLFFSKKIHIMDGFMVGNCSMLYAIVSEHTA